MKTRTGIDFTLRNYLLVNSLLLYCRLFNIYIFSFILNSPMDSRVQQEIYSNNHNLNIQSGNFSTQESVKLGDVICRY